jgi:hypothetical protein
MVLVTFSFNFLSSYRSSIRKCLLLVWIKLSLWQSYLHFQRNNFHRIYRTSKRRYMLCFNARDDRTWCFLPSSCTSTSIISRWHAWEWLNCGRIMRYLIRYSQCHHSNLRLNYHNFWYFHELSKILSP